MAPGFSPERLPIWQRILLGLCILVLIAIIPVVVTSLFPGSPGPGSTHGPVAVKILAVNDFHGQIPEGQSLENESAGSAPVLASYLSHAANETPGAVTFIALPGDVVGASPPDSGLLLDEPTLLFFNEFATGCCGETSGSCTESCNIVATPGNHEFDRGVTEMLRKIHGGNGTTTITHLTDPYPGSQAAYVGANVVWSKNQTPVLPPYVIRNAGGTKIAFIGADTSETPSLTVPGATDGVVFLNESEAINRYVTEIQAQGIHAIVVLLHEGGSQDPYTGPTRENTTVTGRVASIVSSLDPDVDVVLSAHTHQFTNAYINNSGNNPVLVTQAYSYSRAFADIDIAIDPATDEIVAKSAQIVPAYADQYPGTAPDPAAATLLRNADTVVSAKTGTVEAVSTTDIMRQTNAAGESALGDLVADSERSSVQADAAFITLGSLRADLKKGNVTWGDLFTVQPFSNQIYAVGMSGRQIRNVLERQWTDPLPPHSLAVSGLTYSYDPSRPAGDRVTEVSVGGELLNESKTYRVAIVSYLYGGGDGYTEFANATLTEPGPLDIDALSAYISALPQPVNVTTDNRVRVV
ncbi:MAG: bifunctional metallophosphatase/5'-nucleotidase [Methanoregula sp.]|jgi:5'-nucleotidase